MSEDVINVLGKREQPIQNFALFDGDGLDGRIYSLYSPPPELAMASAGLDGLTSLPEMQMQNGNGVVRGAGPTSAPSQFMDGISFA